MKQDFYFFRLVRHMLTADVHVGKERGHIKEKQFKECLHFIQNIYNI